MSSQKSSTVSRWSPQSRFTVAATAMVAALAVVILTWPDSAPPPRGLKLKETETGPRLGRRALQTIEDDHVTSLSLREMDMSEPTEDSTASIPRTFLLPHLDAQPKRAPTLSNVLNATTGQIPGVPRSFWTVLRDSNPRVLYIHNLLTDEECDEIKAQSEPQMKRSMVIAQAGKDHEEVNSVRTSFGVFLGDQGTANKALRERATRLVGIPPDHAESTQVLRYQAEQFYKPHGDYFDENDRIDMDRGGQRIATVVTWLNHCENGGTTSFPMAQLAVPPKKGDAVLFYDVDENASVDPFSTHGGDPPHGNSEKWVAILWMHPRTFH